MTHLEMRAIMLDLGMTQAELARAMGMSPRTVKVWARGPRPGRLARIPAAAVALLRQARHRGYWKPPPRP